MERGVRQRHERRERLVLPAALVVAVGVGARVQFAVAAPPEAGSSPCRATDPETGLPQIDPLCFFDVLVERYRGLAEYADTVRVLQVTRRAGEAPMRVETRLGCEVADGRLRVHTSSSYVRSWMGLDFRYRTSPAMDDAALKYNIWLAPHMALKFTEEPSRDFRSGVEEGFVATDAKTVVLDDRTLVHLELRSAERGHEEGAATFDLYVNPESMLVEHIRGQQRLPDGAEYETRLDITPTRAENAAAPTPAAPPAPPLTLPG